MTMMDANRSTEEGLKNMALLCYILLAASFVVGVTSIVAVVIGHLKLPDSRGTWLESHFRWQVRTFWFGLLWSVLGLITFFIIIGYFILVANVVWVIYRIARGWLALAENKPMYAQ
jgi:uncharacterized membrane protein